MTTQQTSRTVADIIDHEYKDYSMYTIYSRAIPSMIDGLKPVQRKILYTATKVARTKKMKTAALGGYVIAQTGYHHGDTSVNDATTKMAAPYNNIAPLLDHEGSFGSRLVPAAASPRYTFVQLSKTFDKYFTDFDVTDIQSDPEFPEPLYYLPVIPWSLVNGAKGIATGFATNILMRDPVEIANACKDYIDGKNIDSYVLAPSYPFFKGTFTKDVDDNWVCNGVLNRTSSTIAVVEEVPVGFTREKYIEVLDKLEEANKIVGYQDQCSKTGFKFTITLKRGGSLSDKKLTAMLKLSATMKENITVLDHRNRLRVYDNPIDVVKDFCDFRITKVQERIAFNEAKDTNKRDLVLEKMRFIDDVLNGNIIMKNKSKKDLKSQMTKLKYATDIQDNLVGMPIYSLSTDTLKSLAKEHTDLEKSIKFWQATTPKKEYVKDLKAVIK